jgi:hypothetical protein
MLTYAALDCRDFARLVVLNSTVEMTGLDFQAALRASGKVQVSVERCHFMRNTHAVGVFDCARVKVAACVLEANDQGAFVAYERQRPVTGNPPDESLFPCNPCDTAVLRKRDHAGEEVRRVTQDNAHGNARCSAAREGERAGRGRGGGGGGGGPAGGAPTQSHPHNRLRGSGGPPKRWGWAWKR